MGSTEAPVPIPTTTPEGKQNLDFYIDIKVKIFIGSILYIHTISFLFHHVLIVDECSYQYDAEKGLFSTVGFPDDYAENSNCSWEITVPQDHKVQLTFHLLNVSLKTIT